MTIGNSFSFQETNVGLMDFVPANGRLAEVDRVKAKVATLIFKPSADKMRPQSNKNNDSKLDIGATAAREQSVPAYPKIRQGRRLERVKGIEPSYSAWEA
ncbi:hypothetical protein [Rhizobium skierniewicense]|uniref:hypothetical protein n=1 Tax=Rhizobium skierniewicense TaxID=984260 RepID=UPI00160B4D9C|nr:hypothetical protein [Rhizobium skierniewicense]